MERNLYTRIEIMFPILDETCQKRIKQEIFKNYLKDNCDAWEMKSNGTYKPIRNGTHSAQETLLALYKESDLSPIIDPQIYRHPT